MRRAFFVNIDFEFGILANKRSRRACVIKMNVSEEQRGEIFWRDATLGELAAKSGEATRGTAINDGEFIGASKEHGADSFRETKKFHVNDCSARSNRFDHAKSVRHRGLKRKLEDGSGRWNPRRELLSLANRGVSGRMATTRADAYSSKL